MQTEEGKAVPIAGTGNFDYNYYLGDNLGNTRLSFDTRYGIAKTLQQDDYYPFGLEISRTSYTPKNEYLYNRKELQEEFTEYDYGTRFYDPIIGGWNTIDPLAESYRRWSTYHYVADNPIRIIDADGMGFPPLLVFFHQQDPYATQMSIFLLYRPGPKPGLFYFSQRQMLSKKTARCVRDRSEYRPPTIVGDG